MMTDFQSFLFRLTLIGLIASAAPTAGWAGNGDFGEFPEPNVKARSGLALQVDTQWLGETGYRPIRIAVQPLGTVPTVRDRTLHVELTRNNYTTVVDVEIPQGTGAAGVTKTVLLAEGGSWQYDNMRINVSENGRILSDLSGYSFGSSAERELEQVPTILFVDDDAPSLRRQRIGPYTFSTTTNPNPGNRLPNLSTIFSIFSDEYQPQADKGWTDQVTMREIQEWPLWNLIPTGDLPDQWLGLSSVDMVMISLDRLKAIQSHRPEKFEALLRWNQAGGTLVVTGAGDDYANLPTIEKMLALRLTADPPRPPAVPKNDRRWPGWRRPDPVLFDDPRPLYDRTEEEYADNNLITVPAVVEETTEEPPEPGTRAFAGHYRVETARQAGFIDCPPFMVHENMTGVVVVMASQNPFPGEKNVWQWMFATASRPQLFWTQRHGLDKCSWNSDYWRFYMSEVGLPPVTGFRVLITLFAILIGPVNFWVLSRYKRLHLLVLTVPAGALLVTAGLFAYALLADGLGVKARMRSYTELDQRSGRAVCWSRQAYFAGIVPSAGLQYPLDAAVYPINPGSQSYRSRPHYVWGEKQQLQSVLPPRTIGQVMVVYPQKTALKLEITEPAAPAPPRVVNRLGTDIERLWLRGKDGRLWKLEGLAPDAQAEPQPCEALDALLQWNKNWRENRLETPEGIDLDEFSRYGSYRYYYYGRNEEPDGDRSILETRLRFPSQFGPISPNSPPRLQQAALEQCLPPGEYLALVRRPSTVPVGIEKIEEKDSLHMIRGRW